MSGYIMGLHQISKPGAGLLTDATKPLVGLGGGAGSSLELGKSLVNNSGSSFGGAASGASNFGSIAGGIANGVNAIVSAWQLGETISQNKKTNAMNEKNYLLAKEQYEDEKARYEKREKERLEANEKVADSASLFDTNPMTRR